MPLDTILQKPKTIHFLSALGIFLISGILSTCILFFDFQDNFKGEEFIVGEPAPRTIFSSLSLTYENRSATQHLREEAAKSVSPVFRISEEWSKKTRQDLQNFFSPWAEAAAKKNAGETTAIPILDYELSRPNFEVLWTENQWIPIKLELEILTEKLIQTGLLDSKEKQALLDGQIKTATLFSKEKSVEQHFPVSEVWTEADLKRFVESHGKAELIKNKGAKNALMEVLAFFFRPNAIRDDKETEERQKKAADAVSPVLASVKKNELIAQRGMLITPEDKAKLDALEKALLTKEILTNLVSLSIYSMILYLIVFAAFWFFSPKSFVGGRPLILFHVTSLLTLGLCKVIMVWPGASPYLMPAPLAPLLLVILGFPFHALVSAILTGLWMIVLSKFSLGITTASMIAGLVAIFAGKKIRKRIEFLKAGTWIGIAYFSTLLVFRSFSGYPFLDSVQLCLPGLVNGLVISVCLAFLLVPIFESLFDVTTDITLLEMSDLNHPLLKRMIVEAPGTYHHSLVVSTLAESASEAIGANALLARVGCYFHDIGKIAHSEFFTENQERGRNRHEEMSPRMSSMIIMNHVKDGIDLGRKYKLKNSILKFIPEHQGTGVVYFFYRKALDQAKPGEKIDPDQFRYPGPKPQSRETAIALLSDSVEASSRSLKEPTPESIRSSVRKIINDKFIDGQLDECDLTLKDLHQIQESFVKNLMAIFHTRVAYPDQPKNLDQPNLFQSLQNLSGMKQQEPLK